VLQEVLSGMTSQKQFAELRRKLLAGLTVVRASVEDHVEAACPKNLCLSKGLNVSGIDCLIAATVIAGDHELFAVDGDFGEISKHVPLRLLRETDVARLTTRRPRPRPRGTPAAA
jgi:predicted nucleic acid-binding protein